MTISSLTISIVKTATLYNIYIRLVLKRRKEQILINQFRTINPSTNKFIWQAPVVNYGIRPLEGEINPGYPQGDQTLSSRQQKR